MERSSDRNRPAIAAPGEGGGAGAGSPRLGWNPSTTSGLPRITQVQMPKTRPIGQAHDQGTMARIADVAARGYQRSRRIVTALDMSTVDTGTIRKANRVRLSQRKLGSG